MLGSILGAVAGPLIGGLFGGSRQKTQKTTNEVDYVKLRENAEKGGFNPLTALRHGGAAGHMITTHPALSSPGAGGAIGQAIGDVAMGLSGSPWSIPSAAPTNQHEARADQITYQILEKQLRHYTTNAPSPGARMGDVPVMVQTSPGQGSRVTESLTQQAQQNLPGRYDFFGTTLPTGVRPSLEALQPEYGDEVMDWEGRRRAASELGQNAIDAWKRGLQTQESYNRNLMAPMPKFRPVPAAPLPPEEPWHGGWLPTIKFRWNDSL